MFRKSNSDVLPAIERELKTLLETNARVMKELQAQDMYDRMRGVSSGGARTHFALSAIEQNKVEIRRLEQQIEEIRASRDKSWTFRKLFFYYCAGCFSCTSCYMALCGPRIPKPKAQKDANRKAANTSKTQQKARAQPTGKTIITLKSLGTGGKKEQSLDTLIKRAASADYKFTLNRVEEEKKAKVERPPGMSEAQHRFILSRSEEEFTGRKVVRPSEAKRQVDSVGSATTSGTSVLTDSLPAAPSDSPEPALGGIEQPILADGEFAKEANFMSASASPKPTVDTVTRSVTPPETAPLKELLIVAEDKSKSSITGDAVEERLREKKIVRRVTESKILPSATGSSSQSGFFPYEALKRGCPTGVNPDKKEDALSDEDFANLFNMSREAFTAQPKWRKDNLKKQLSLF